MRRFYLEKDHDSFSLYYLKEDWIKKEKEKAKKLKKTSWWRKKTATGICYYCKRKFKPKDLTMDHKIPLSRGGMSIKENLVPCCKECNFKKKYLLPIEWEEYMNKIRHGFV